MKIYFTLFLLMVAFSLNAQSTIEVSITGFKNEEGKAMIGLYDSKEQFLRKVYKSIAAPIKNGKVAVSFQDVPQGNYAISVYHDENDNGKLDRFMGMMPTEDYGNSNNIPPRFGPPKWEDAMFGIEKDGVTEIDIEMM